MSDKERITPLTEMEDVPEITDPKPEASDPPAKRRLGKWVVLLCLLLFVFVIGLSAPARALYGSLWASLLKPAQNTSSGGETLQMTVSAPVDEVRLAGYTLRVPAADFNVEEKGSALHITPKNRPLNRPAVSLVIEQFPGVSVSTALSSVKKKMNQSDPPPKQTETLRTDGQEGVAQPQAYHPTVVTGIWDWVNGVALRHRPVVSVRAFKNGKGGVFLITETRILNDSDDYDTQFDDILASFEIAEEAR